MSIFDDFLSGREAQEAFAARPFIAAMLRFEEALAHAQAGAGLITAGAHAGIAAACDVSRHDVAQIVQASAAAGSVPAALESSETRSRLLQGNDIIALGVDIANTARAANTAEKLVAHEIALAHKIAMEQARRAQYERDPTIELRRLQISARMMETAQQGVLTLQKLKTGGTQNVVVQHVHVESGGQAVVGNIQGRRSPDS